MRRKKAPAWPPRELLHSKRVVRAFNCIGAASLASDGFRQPAQLAIPIGGDDARPLRRSRSA